MPDETATAGGGPVDGSGASTPNGHQPAGTAPEPQPGAPPAPAPGSGVGTHAGGPGTGPTTDAPPVARPSTPVDQGTLRSMELLHGVEMSVTIELGRTKLLMRDVLALHTGSVVELDRSASAPVDVLVNGTLLARGEVVVVDDELGVRLVEIVSDRSGAER